MTSDVIQKLINDAAVQALPGIVSPTGAIKAYPMVAPENEKEPFYTVKKVKTENFSAFNCLASTDWCFYQVWSWSKNYITTEEMQMASRTALEDNDMFLVDCVDGFDNASDMYCQIATYKRQESI